MPNDFISNLVQFGLAGLIIFIILRPILNWMMARADQKDLQIKEMIDNHFLHDRENHSKLIDTLEILPDKVADKIVLVLKKTKR